MKARTLVGGIVLILGFLMYQTGIAVALEKNPNIFKFIKYMTSPLRINLEADIFVITVGYFGGIIAILGLLICISSLIEKKASLKTRTAEKSENKNLEPEVQNAIEKVLKSS